MFNATENAMNIVFLLLAGLTIVAGLTAIYRVYHGDDD